MLGTTIRHAILQAYLAEIVVGEFDVAIKFYSRALALIDAARAQWPGQEGPATAGSSLLPSFSA